MPSRRRHSKRRSRSRRSHRARSTSKQLKYRAAHWEVARVRMRDLLTDAVTNLPQLMHEKDIEACKKIDVEKTEYADANVVTSVGEELGRGFFGKVRLVTCNDGKKRAEKVQVIQGGQDVINELKTLCLSRLFDNKHILGFVDHKSVGTSFYILMDVMHGSVASLSKPVDMDTVNQLATQISKALLAVSAAGVSHNDVKPENVMYTRNENSYTFRLIDFGISTRKGEHVTGGAPAYVPPEYFAENNFGWGGDAWAIGVLLHELIAGEHPFTKPLLGMRMDSKEDENKMLQHVSDLCRQLVSSIDIDIYYKHLYHADPTLRNDGLQLLVTRNGFSADEYVSIQKPISLSLLPPILRLFGFR